MKGQPLVGDKLLTTGEAAQLLGTSRQHVVDLCERGALPFSSAGRHRRIRRSDLLAFQRQGRTGGLTRDQLRSLWLHRAIAGKLVLDPDRILGRARGNLRRLQAAHPRGQAARMLADWAQLLDGPAEDVAEVLTSKDQRAVELRQNSPFAGLLSERERMAVLRSFKEGSIPA